MIRKDSKEIDYMELGKFYFMNNKFGEAIAEFKKVLELNPSSSEALYNIGLIKEVSKLPNEAKDMYSKALAINPDYKIARDRLNKLIGIEK
ncbi:MAG: tetratricopeptide repeat protein [Endomicrobium sp.]|jgi:tetratricopeptide (TPR) repeat protein|nr:tetratricopeptide repeat protein [Endomicrobium sp.]